MEARVKTAIWIQAQVRLCDRLCLPAMVANRGDGDAGAVLLRVNACDGTSRLYSQTRDGEGRPAWLQPRGPGPLPDAEVDAYIARQLDFDPDLWVLEIEDRHGSYELDAPLA